MIQRFQDRAEAVKRRGFPPVEGPERLLFIEAAKLDFQDFAMLADATATLEDGILRLDEEKSLGPLDRRETSTLHRFGAILETLDHHVGIKGLAHDLMLWVRAKR
jgi:hypothetical protein